VDNFYGYVFGKLANKKLLSLHGRNLLDNLIQSLQSESGSCERANGRNPELASSEGSPLFPYPLKPLLVEGAWDKVRSRLVPLEAGGTVPIRDF
jgi:hypothetical protein